MEIECKSANEIGAVLSDKYPNAFKPDLLTGGPPCQGHSISIIIRRGDARNNLYFRMVRKQDLF